MTKVILIRYLFFAFELLKMKWIVLSAKSFIKI